MMVNKECVSVLLLVLILFIPWKPNAVLCPEQTPPFPPLSLCARNQEESAQATYMSLLQVHPLSIGFYSSSAINVPADPC